jgi:glycosyltransferase involved in cell wall biosynthesis
MQQRVLVAVPAWNESATIARVISEVRAELPQADVLVVDDGSTDTTAQCARSAGAEVVTLPFNVGVGGAMRTAFLFARENGYSAVVQVDADGQHVPAHIPAMLDELAHHSIVIGARFAGSGDYRVRGPRKWAMKLLAHTLSRVCRARLTDATSGFRASDARAIALFSRHYPAEYLGDTVESLVIAARAGLPVTQIPVTMRPRQGGQASQSAFRSALYLGRAALALSVAIARRPVAEVAG